VLLILVGALFLLTGAFHDALWFDESYSVAIARMSYDQIWVIGSYDVHPVLYYWALHTLYLVFGTNLVVYRIFTICGTVALALLGITHIRRDFGVKAGVLFSFLVLFLPYFSYISIQIRMYSWAMFTVMLTWIYALRIGRAERASWKTWGIFFVASLASAYLHYYALLSVFIINVALFIYLVAHHATRKRDLVVCVVQAVVEVAAFMPWFLVLLSQLGVVSTSYWVRFDAGTVSELLRYPVVTMQLYYALMGNYGPVITTLSIVAVSLLVIWAIWFIARMVQRGVRKHPAPPAGQRPNRLRRLWRYVTCEDNAFAFLGLGLYLMLVVLALVVSAILGSLMVYYRYLSIALGPVVIAIVWLLLKVERPMLVKTGCALLLIVSVLSQGLLIHDDYSDLNGAPFVYLAENVEQGDVLVSSDIGFVGQTSLYLEDVEQYYLDWQYSTSWSRAYEVYSPPMESIKSWQDVLDGDKERIWVLGTTYNASPPRDLQDLLKTSDVVHEEEYTLVQYETFYRPYERTYYTVALLERTNGS
jgi:4-amino-4-deoxy-L-arabinose transferase-like glycosyltransferase